MGKRRTAVIVALILVYEAIGIGLFPDRTSADERFAMRINCPSGTLQWDADSIDHLSVAQQGDQPVLTFELGEEASGEFAELTQRSIGLTCHLYANTTLISSFVIRSPIRGGIGVVEMDAELAKKLVESYEAGRTDE